MSFVFFYSPENKHTQELFVEKNWKASVLANEFPEESDQFRFLRASCFANLKGVVGLIMEKGIGYADFNPPGPLISVFHTVSSFHPFASSHTASSSCPGTVSSAAICLNSTCLVFILTFHWILWSS